MDCFKCPYSLKNDTYCLKLGGTHIEVGFCDECIDRIPQLITNLSKYKRKNKYLRNKTYKLNTIKNVEILEDWWIYDTQNYFNWIYRADNGKLYAKRFYKSASRKLAKKMTNKVVRHSSVVPNYGGYRKCFDYFWTVF